ncbi:MAG: tetratricopeptide repeat protein [Candidatus Rokuibacteriota bacterium]
MKGAGLGLGLVLLGASAAQAHVVLDGDQVQALLGGIARELRATREAPAAMEQAESQIRLGEGVDALVELLNQDLAAHGDGNLLPQLVVRRLEAYGVSVTLSPRTRRYVYDLAAFREYLRRAPAGRWAAEARFRLIAARFHEAPAPDTTTGSGDVAALRDAVREQERFLRDYPRHERAPLVRFYLGVDAYRVMRAAPDAGTVQAYKQQARRALEEVADAGGETAEARAAQVLLERLSAPERP